MAKEPTPTPVDGNAAGLGFGDGAVAPHLDPTFVNGQALALLAQNVTPITWRFDEEAKAYFGTAPYGTFELRRDTASPRLYCDYKSNCETHSSRMFLIEDSVAEAKAAILPRLLDTLNQSRRLELVIPKPAEPTAAPAEPDLI